MSKNNGNETWFEFSKDKIKIKKEISEKYKISSDSCCECNCCIISLSFQQNVCGSRYCEECYNQLSDKYYCSVCKIDSPDNFVHNKCDIFEDKALMKDLIKSVLWCPDCRLEMAIIKLQEHLRICPKGWMNCDKCNQMVKKSPQHKCEAPNNKQLPKVIYKTCTSCGKEFKDVGDFDVHKCSISWIGSNCPYDCSDIDNTTMEDHRKYNNLYHLDRAWAIIKENKLDHIKDETSQKFGELLKSISDEIKETLKIESNKVENLQKELQKLSENIKEEISIYDSIKSSLKTQISDSLYTSFDGTILWKIEKFDTVKKAAIDGIQKSVFSPPFYTSRFGYKMCLRLYPNGDSTAKGVAMSLFLVIMKGKYDSLLTWPFKQKVTFILLDQEFKTNHIDAFVPSDNLTSFQRPRTDMNIPSGSSYFIKFEDMKLHKYVKDDTIFIRCIIDCSDLRE